MKGNKDRNLGALLILPFVYFIKIYQYFISPTLGTNCRHYPSCSHYSIQSFEKYGFFKGAILTLARILRCNPWGLGGYDPVPENVRFTTISSFKFKGNYQNQLYKKSDDDTHQSSCKKCLSESI